MVDDPAVERGEEEARQHGAKGDARGVLAGFESALDAEHDAEQRELVEAVAEAADDLAVPEPGEIFFAQDAPERGGRGLGGHADGL